MEQDPTKAIGGKGMGRPLLRLVLGVAMIAGTAFAEGGPVFGARGHETHHAVVNLLLGKQIQTVMARTARLQADSEIPSISVIVHSDGDIRQDVTKLGGTVVASIGGITAIHLTANRVDDLAHVPDVISLGPNLRQHLTLDQSVPEIRAPQVWSQNDSTGTPLQGSHVIVGIVDSGIDYRNADFNNPDGTTRIKYIWDQTVSGHAPAGFGFGYECDATSINSGQCPEKDTVGHGTHVAGIAAGNGGATSGHEVGVAPKADIIVVKADLTYEKELAAWQYLLQKSKQLNEPIAINNSWGGEIDPHDGSAPLDIAADHMTGTGHVLVAAAGNDGNGGAHATGQIGQGGSASVPFVLSGHKSTVAIALFYPNRDSISVALRDIPSGVTGSVVTFGHEFKNSTKDGDSTIDLVNGRWDDNHRGILLLVKSKSGRAYSGHLSFELKGTTVADSGRFDAWMENYAQGSFDHPTETDTVGEPANGRNIIAVGNYTTRLSWTDRTGKTRNACDAFPCDKKGLQVGQINYTSSIGPTFDNRQKPDISAPGTMILSSLSRDALSCGDPNASDECIVPQVLDADGHSLVATGTSMSAPHVTGVAALMLQADPTLDQATITNILRNTARHDAWTGGGWSPTYGAGKVDALAAVQDALAAPKLPTSTPAPPPSATPRPTATPKPTPIPPHAPAFGVRFLGVHLVNNEAAPHFSSIKAGVIYYPFIYWEANENLPTAKPGFTLTVTLNGKVVAKASEKAKHPGYPVGQYYAGFKMRLNKPGNYVLTGKVTIRSTSHIGTLGLTVTP